MKLIILLTIFASQISCSSTKTLKLDINKIDRIEVYQGYPGNKVPMKVGFENNFIADLNKSKDLGPTKYMKTHRILIYYKDNNTDTIYTNGNIHQFKNWYKSSENLIEKYALNETVLSDTVVGQLKTAQKLELLMTEKKYDEAILLFSQRQQKSINELKKEPEMFNYWCLAWTFDKAKFERYTNRIKSGNGNFVFEENEWKIDEK